MQLDRMNRRDFIKLSSLVGAAAATGGAGVLLDACSSGTQGSGNKIVLNQWYHQYGEAGTQQAAMRYAAEYSAQNPNIQVNVGWIPGDYVGKLNAALLTSSGPDIFETEAVSPTAVAAGQYAPLDDLLPASMRSQRDPHEAQLFTVGNHLYSVAMVGDIGVMYYRKSLLAKVGASVPNTFADFADLANRLTSGSVKGAFLGNDGGLSRISDFLHAGGVSEIQGTKIAYDTDATVQVLQQLRAINTSKAILLGAPTDWFDPGSFIGGLTAMQWCGLWAMPGIKKALGDDFAVGPLPAMGGSTNPATFYLAWGQSVNGKSQHLAEAKAFVDWLWIKNTKDQQDFNLAYGFHLPPSLDLQANATPLKTGPAADVVQFASKDGYVESVYYTAAVAQPLIDAATNVVKKGADAASEVHKAAVKAQAELDKVLAAVI